MWITMRIESMTIKSASLVRSLSGWVAPSIVFLNICGGEIALPCIVIHFCCLVNIYYEFTSGEDLKNTLNDAEFSQLMM